MASAKDPRWKRPYTELAYQPIQERLKYLRDNDTRPTVTGGGQDFVRQYADKSYGVPAEQVIGTAGALKYGLREERQADADEAAQVAAQRQRRRQARRIQLMIGRRPERPSAIRPATSRCSSTAKPVKVRGSQCWCCTTMRSANQGHATCLSGCQPRRPSGEQYAWPSGRLGRREALPSPIASPQSRPTSRTRLLLALGVLNGGLSHHVGQRSRWYSQYTQRDLPPPPASWFSV